MSLTDTTPRGQTDHVSFVLDLPHPPSKVWRALSEPELLADWLLPVFDWKPAPGTAFTFRREPIGGWDGIVHAKVLELEPLRWMKLGWVVGDLDTFVTFALEATDGGARLTVVQGGFREGQKQNWGGARYGWNQMGAALVALLGRVS